MKTVHEFSAGGVALAVDPLRVTVIRVRAPRGALRWVLPKGLAEKGEALVDAGRREVLEETGFEVEVGGALGDSEYWFVLDGVRHHKRVRFFLMMVTGGDPSAHDGEVVEVALMPPDDAVTALAYDDERDMVKEALARIETG